LRRTSYNSYDPETSAPDTRVVGRLVTVRPGITQWSKRKYRTHIGGNTKRFVAYVRRASISNAQVNKLHNTQ